MDQWWYLSATMASSQVLLVALLNPLLPTILFAKATASFAPRHSSRVYTEDYTVSLRNVRPGKSFSSVKYESCAIPSKWLNNNSQLDFKLYSQGLSRLQGLMGLRLIFRWRKRDQNIDEQVVFQFLWRRVW